MEERRMNETESFELITAMVKSARTNMRAKINCNILLVWGYTIPVISILIWILKIKGIFPLSSLLWFLVPIICYPTTRYLSSKDNINVKSYLDQMIDYISILFIIICITTGVISIWAELPVFFAEGLLCGTWVTIIGLLIKYKPVIWGGIAGITVAHGLLFVPADYQILAFSAIFVFSIIIPGHLFKRSIRNHV